MDEGLGRWTGYLGRCRRGVCTPGGAMRCAGALTGLTSQAGQGTELVNRSGGLGGVALVWAK